MWKLTARNMWIDGKWNPELDKILKDGWEPFASVTSVYGVGAGTFLGGAVDVNSQPIILFRKSEEYAKSHKSGDKIG